MINFDECRKPAITVTDLFYILREAENKDNVVFETKAVNEPFNQICELLPKEYQAHEKSFDTLCKLVEETAKNAFEIGFNIAKELFR